MLYNLIFITKMEIVWFESKLREDKVEVNIFIMYIDVL